MSEEIDYAEMLEIPVATVNVVKKKRRRFRDLKLQAVGKVNERMENRTRERDKMYAGNEFTEEISSAESVEKEEGEPVASNTDVEDYERPQKRAHPVVVVEFALACLLCLAIFLTNVFVSDSAINTFIRAVVSPSAGGQTAAKTYSDFKLSGVVSEYAEVETTLSSTGVLSFDTQCSVYPACDGTVNSVTQSGDTYTVVVSHSDSFESVYNGLSSVYCQKGDVVRSNVPFAYADGKNTVQVSFYQDGSMLNCYSVDAENCLSWNK